MFYHNSDGNVFWAAKMRKMDPSGGFGLDYQKPHPGYYSLSAWPVECGMQTTHKETDSFIKSKNACTTYLAGVLTVIMQAVVLERSRPYALWCCNVLRKSKVASRLHNFW